MGNVHLRKINTQNYRECITLQVGSEQTEFVASNVKSLAQASVDEQLTPLAVYDAAACGYEISPVPMVGFTMYEITAGVGFIMRLMIDHRYQRQGYGRATMLEVIRRLKLSPDVEMIATSHKRENHEAAQLYQSLGFVPWEVSWAHEQSDEVYLRLPQ